MKRQNLTVLMCAISILLFSISALAETITLKSGKKVEGKIIEKTDESIKIDFHGVGITYYFDEIEAIDGKTGWQNKEGISLVAEKSDFGSPKEQSALLPLPSNASEENWVFIPFIFSVERKPIKTSAYIRVKRKLYEPEGGIWENFQKSPHAGVENILVETFSALFKKDEARMEALSHPDLLVDRGVFKKQISDWFNQFESMQVTSIVGYYLSGDLLDYYVKLKSGSLSVTPSITFKKDASGTYKFYAFTPANTNAKNAFDLIHEWHYSEWGPEKASSPTCYADLPERKWTHKIDLADADVGKGESPVELFLSGRSISNAENLDSPYSDILRGISNRKKLLSENKMDEFFNCFTEGSGKYQRKWFYGEITDAEREQYTEAHLRDEKLFYVFDADPFFILFSNSQSFLGLGPPYPLYYIRAEDNSFKWANASTIIANVDNVFDKQLRNFALEEKPFNSLKITNNETGSTPAVE